MSLIKCPMRGKEISPNAVACLNCGEPICKEDLCNNVRGINNTETDNNLYHIIIEM